MATIFKSILFCLLTFSILPAYAAAVICNGHHCVYVNGHHGHRHYHHYCYQQKQWVPGRWVYRPAFDDRIWVPGHWVWVRWCR